MPKSVATIDKPEFINITPMNPLISQCEIKVLYVGQNRNRSFISKEVAMDMANSLPGCPIVGYFNEGKEDFTDHGQRITMDGDGVKFECLTKPYGFVAPDAQVWFQIFDDTDAFGNVIQREYMMTTGYLWTGQYEEAMRVIEEGNNQSMELDEKTLQGNWATDNKTGVEFFIINDAIFSKLTILGKDVEPCFEGAAVGAPTIKPSFSLDEEFKTTLSSMMHDLRTAIETKEGGLNMTKEELIASGKVTTQFTAEERSLFTDDELGVMLTAEQAAAQEAAEVEFAAKTAEEEEAAAADEKPEEEKETPPTKAACADDEKTKMQLQTDFEKLQGDYESLESEVIELRKFKLETENTQKDALIDSFYMLSDEDKEDVIKNKTSYSLEDIEGKLSIICVRKKVSFDLDREEEEVDTPVDASLIFSLDSEDAGNIPPHVQVLRDAKKSN